MSILLIPPSNKYNRYPITLQTSSNQKASQKFDAIHTTKLLKHLSSTLQKIKRHTVKRPKPMLRGRNKQLLTKCCSCRGCILSFPKQLALSNNIVHDSYKSFTSFNFFPNFIHLLGPSKCIETHKSLGYDNLVCLFRLYLK